MDQQRQDRHAEKAGEPKETEIVATADVRIAEYVLAPGVSNRWHHHSVVSDRFYCLEGTLTVETRGPEGGATLRPGETFLVSPRVVHHVRNQSEARTRYLLIQAGGAYDFVPAE